jgi:hypothetical protein
VQALVETVGFRHIGVVHDEYAVSPDGMKMFGVLDLATEMEGCRFSIGLRNSHDKSMRLAMTCGYRVFVCSNMAFSGEFTPMLAKTFPVGLLIDCVSVSTRSAGGRASYMGSAPRSGAPDHQFHLPVPSQVHWSPTANPSRCFTRQRP